MGDDVTSQSRLDLWAEARAVAAENPWTGIGYRNWRLYQSGTDIYGESGLVIHNTVLEAFVEVGVPGGVLFLALVVATLLVNFKSIRRFSGGDPTSRSLRGIATGLSLSIVGMIIAAQFMSVLFYPMFWLIFALSAAMRTIAVQNTARLESTDLTIGRRRRWPQAVSGTSW